MTAMRVLQGGGWVMHSLQQDGVLAEPGRLADGAPAEPLAALTPRVSQAIRAEHGLSIEIRITYALTLPIPLSSAPADEARRGSPPFARNIPLCSAQRSASSGADLACGRSFLQATKANATTLRRQNLTHDDVYLRPGR